MKVRARELGIHFDGAPGKWNAITDVPGVWVGQTTLISGHGKLIIGEGPVRTGVTAIRPRGEHTDPVFAAWYSLNGCGEMTGTTWIEESGLLHGPVLLTNTLSVGLVHQATIEWVLKNFNLPFGMPVVTETYDGFLNDIRGYHIQKEHVFHALDNAHSGPVEEGNTGGGTGNVCYKFKGGTGTASRLLLVGNQTFTVGVLVQANHGSRHQLTISGVPVGKEIHDLNPGIIPPVSEDKNSSVVVIAATDLPLLPHQLKRLAKRIPLGLARTGAMSEYTSGDIFLAFSTANRGNEDEDGFMNLPIFTDWGLDPFFEAVVQTTEEAVVNALVSAEIMSGINDYTVYPLPHDRLPAIFRKYGRLTS